ncbi:hypothetical protein ACFORL_03325 [Legionella dresdenensis]|uniref:Uncharacterized protein n=1 Tax=Legionella dresdenensis TaxID=450200 RepID=A0ABV8CDQ6_9GAMM
MDKSKLGQTLITLNIDARTIPGLINNENHNQEQIERLMSDMTKEQYDHEEIFGQFCQLGAYIACPPEMAFEYCSNVLSLGEWTFSMRNFEYIGGQIWRSEERLGKNTFVYTKVNAYPDSGVVDYLCAWDQAFELWMRYYFRFIDAQPTLNKPGTVVLWTNCKHPYYDRATPDLPDYIKKGHEQTNRAWVGDFWHQFDAIHKIEMNNLKRILEHRFKAMHAGFI